MTAAEPHSTPHEESKALNSTKQSMDKIEALLEETANEGLEQYMFDGFDEGLKVLHAQVRLHHSIDCLSSACSASSKEDTPIPPRFAEDVNRLHNEHTTILGMLDRLVRSAGAIADQPIEDKEVFVMKVRELVAVIRRHEAEEDRILYLALWGDIGGEC